MADNLLYSSLGWIDFSPTHRNRVGTVLDLLRPEGMVDELGLSTVRDALSNHLFPGISTIQTRAKYFFIIPYILYEYQQLPTVKRKSKTASQYLEQREYEIMWQLADNYEHEEGHGVIGITKYRPEKIVRRPSAIYWNGLYNFDFINTKGLATEAFLRQATRQTLSELLSLSKEGDDSKDDADAGYENLFRLRIPPKKNWATNLTLDLDKDEAEIFRDKIFSKANNKLLSELLHKDEVWKVFKKSDGFMGFAKQIVFQRNPDSISKTITMAHDFSELMYGAHLHYNYILQQKVFQSNFYLNEWREWVKQLRKTMIDYNGFDPNEILQKYALTTRSTTAEFIKDWWRQAQSDFKNTKKLEQLITQQEVNAKGSKARLRWNKTEDVKEDKWIGLTFFDYRFFQVRTIINDIKQGLK